MVSWKRGSSPFVIGHLPPATEASSSSRRVWFVSVFVDIVSLLFRCAVFVSPSDLFLCAYGHAIASWLCPAICAARQVDHLCRMEIRMAAEAHARAGTIRRRAAWYR